MDCLGSLDYLRNKEWRFVYEEWDFFDDLAKNIMANQSDRLVREFFDDAIILEYFEQSIGGRVKADLNSSEKILLHESGQVIIGDDGIEKDEFVFENRALLIDFKKGVGELTNDPAVDDHCEEHKENGEYEFNFILRYNVSIANCFQASSKQTCDCKFGTNTKRYLL